MTAQMKMPKVIVLLLQPVLCAIGLRKTPMVANWICEAAAPNRPAQTDGQPSRHSRRVTGLRFSMSGADRSLAFDRNARHAAITRVIGHAVVLHRAVVPDRDVAIAPLPAHLVFGTLDLV